MTKATIVAAAILLGTITSTAVAQPPVVEPQSSVWTNLNPMNWSMPKVKAPKLEMPKVKMPLVSNRTPAKTQDNEPGFWKTVSGKTKSTWNTTTSWLNPFDNKPAAKKKTGFFEGLFSEKEETRPVETVGDFLSQPHPY